MKKMYTFCVLAVLILFALPCMAMAEPIDYGEIVLDENMPYSMVIDSINAEEAESDGYIPSVELDEDTALYRSAVVESLDYMVEIGKINLCVLIASAVVILIAIFSMRWIY